MTTKKGGFLIRFGHTEACRGGRDGGDILVSHINPKGFVQKSRSKGDNSPSFLF